MPSTSKGRLRTTVWTVAIVVMGWFFAWGAMPAIALGKTEQVNGPIELSNEGTPSPSVSANEPIEVVDPADYTALVTQADTVVSGVWGECKWLIEDGVLKIFQGTGADTNGESPWSEWAGSITSVVVAPNEGLLVPNEDVVKAPADSSCLFGWFSNLQSADLARLDTSGVTDMSAMFFQCSSLTSLDLTGWDTSGVTDMSMMFSSCFALPSLDLTGWDTSSVSDMFGMFQECNTLPSIAGISALNTSKVTNMFLAFQGCGSLTSLDLSGWDTSRVTNMGGMFMNCASLISLDLSGWDTSSVTTTDENHVMFEGCSSLASIKVGTGYKPVDATMFPEGTWWSRNARNWFASGYIVSDRKGIADTYLSQMEQESISGATATVAAQTYTGKALKPKPTVKLGDKTLVLNTDYTVSYKNNTNAGKGTVVITGKGAYAETKSVNFTIKKAAISKLTLKATSATYNGKAHKPVVKEVKAGSIVVPTTGYTVAFARSGKKTSNFTSAGKVTVTVTGKGNFQGSKSATFTISKATNPMAVKVAAKTVKLSDVKSKAQTVAPISVTKAQGGVTYKKASGSSCLTVNAKTGKVTVKKGTKKGTYSCKVTVAAAGNTNYKKAAKTVTVKITVK